ncbi:MAG: hypothetical protein RMJ35_08660, partial [Phycisphaerales bacterium]|nr:hypothetical protein [Phycisphaerales bacterium]
MIGPRLTGSPACKRANEWTRHKLAEWGLSNARLEPWGPFGRGWSLQRFSIQVVSPCTIILGGHPKAWTPGLPQPLQAEAIWLDARTEAELEPFRGRLSGKVVLIGAMRETEARFEPLANRLSDQELARLAESASGTAAMLGQMQPRALTPSERRAQLAAASGAGERLIHRGARGRTAAATGPATRPVRRGFDRFASRALEFAQNEGAALVLTPSARGDGGTIFVTSAAIPGDFPVPSPATASSPT